MKILIAILLLAPCVSRAENWMRPDEPGPAYELLSSCEQNGKYICQKVDDLDMSALVSKEGQVDDKTKPIYEARSKVKECGSRVDCEKLADGTHCLATHFEKIEVIPESNPLSHEIFCTRVTGYEKKTQLTLVEDPEKKAKTANDKADAETRQTKMATLRTQAKQCASDAKNKDTTDKRMRDCLGIVVKIMMAPELRNIDLEP